MGKAIKRVDDWKEKLDAYVADRAKPTKFVYGVNDCFLTALGAIDAQTGLSLRNEFAERYTSPLTFHAKFSNGSLYAYVNLYFGGKGLPRVPHARRGDIVAFPYSVPNSAGVDCIFGVVTGSKALVPTEMGLRTVSKRLASTIWRV